MGPLLAAEMLEQHRDVTLRARGSSMAPLILDGDVLVLAPLARAPRPGDVVAALSGNRLLVHRVARTREDRAELQGDALWEPDGWFVCRSISEASSVPRIVGRAASLRRDGETLGAWKLSGSRARIFFALSPLVRAWRGLKRRSMHWLRARA